MKVTIRILVAACQLVFSQNKAHENHVDFQFKVEHEFLSLKQFICVRLHLLATVRQYKQSKRIRQQNKFIRNRFF